MHYSDLGRIACRSSVDGIQICIWLPLSFSHYKTVWKDQAKLKERSAHNQGPKTQLCYPNEKTNQIACICVLQDLVCYKDPVCNEDNLGNRVAQIASALLAN